MSRCQRTLRGEGHSAAGWGIGGSVWLHTAGSKVHSFGQWAAATCAAPPSVIAGQYATSVVNRCWSGFPCKWRYINVEMFNLDNGCLLQNLLNEDGVSQAKQF